MQQVEAAPAGVPAESEHRTLVIVPAYNEERALPAVLEDLRVNLAGCEVIVVDDGSIDATAKVGAAAGVRVARLPFNLGVGGALQTGFRFAVDRGFGRAVQFDGDGQHDAREVAVLLAALDDGADLAVGSRFADATTAYPLGHTRRGAMAVLRWTVRVLSGQSFSDISSGFRAFSAPLLEFFADQYPVDYLGDTAEALLLAHRAGFRVVEVPVRIRPRTTGMPSTRNYRLAYHYLRALVTIVGTTPFRRTELRDGRS